MIVEIPRDRDAALDDPSTTSGEKQQIKMNEWSSCVNLKSFQREPLSSNKPERSSMNCSNSTTVDIDVNLLMRSMHLGVDEEAPKYVGKYLATMELLKSPMHLINSRDNYAGSSTTALRKFFKSIDCSSHISDEMNLNSGRYLNKLFVLLNVHETNESKDQTITDTIVLPEFLRDQFQLVHVHSKFLIKAISPLDQKSTDQGKKQTVTLITDSKLDVSSSFETLVGWLGA